MKKLFVALVGLSLGILVSERVRAAEVWVTTTVTAIHAQGNGLILVNIAANPSNCTNANSPKRYLLSVSASYVPTADAFKNIYSALLYASASQREVQIFWESTSANCPITRVIVQN